MELLRLALLFAASPLYSQAGHGQIEPAIAEYRTTYPDHDFEILRGVAQSFLLSARHCDDPQDLLMAVYGAGIAGDPTLIPVLAAGIRCPHPGIQAAAVNLLASLQDDRADEIMCEALASPFLLVRLEACFQLARRRHRSIVLQLDTLMAKVPPPIRPLFPQLYALVGTPEADKALAKFLTDRDAAVRRAAIHSLAKSGRDDFLPQIRRLSLHLDPLQQEVCASALGHLRDSASWDRLESLSRSSSDTVRIAALQSLYLLGKDEALAPLQQLAIAQNPYAIAVLGELEGSEETLSNLLQSSNSTTRLNATTALLLRQDPRSLPRLTDLLLNDNRERAFHLQSSRAGALAHLRTLSAPLAREEGEMLVAISQQLRESLLVEAAHLPEEQFLSLAHTLFARRQDDLVPLLVAILEDMATPAAISLLQRESEHIGAPLIRTYATLALFRTGIPGPYEERLLAYVAAQRHQDIIRLRPVVPWNKRTGGAFELTPDEHSRLLVEALESLAQRQDRLAVDSLLTAIAEGNAHNRYALAGLLIRITQ